MAVTDDGVVLPVSTGAVKTPSEPETYGQVPDPSSTGAVKFDGSPIETRFGPSGQKPAGNVETPGPQTHENLAVKVVRAPGRRSAEGATQAQTTQSDDSSGR